MLSAGEKQVVEFAVIVLCNGEETSRRVTANKVNFDASCQPYAKSAAYLSGIRGGWGNLQASYDEDSLSSLLHLLLLLTGPVTSHR